MIESALFKGVTLVLPEGVREGDLLVKDGKIAKIAPNISATAEIEIKDPGLTILPGAIDTHVHFREPGATHKETIYSGSKSAVAGGVTSFFEMPNTRPATVTEDVLQEKKIIAAKTSLANYNFYIGATQDNLDILNSVENVPAIKIYVGSSTGDLLVDNKGALDAIFSQGNRLIAVHSEEETMIQENLEKYKGTTDPSDHPRIRSAEAALTCTKKLVQLANKHHRRLHILHITTKEEIAFLQSEKSPYVTAEVCPHHLFLWGPGIYNDLGNLAKVNPPIRDKSNATKLWQGLVSGVIQTVGSDHAPHTRDEKQVSFMDAPSGMPGVETMLPLLLNQYNQGNCTLEQLTQWVSAAPAQIFNIQNKGVLKEGYDADLVVLDLAKKQTISAKTQHSKCGWTAFENQQIQGMPIMTLVNGQIVYREGDFNESIKGTEVHCGA